MSSEAEQHDALRAGPSWPKRLRAGRWPLLTAAAVLAVLVGAGGADPLLAAVGFLAVAAALLLAPLAAPERVPRASPPPPREAPGLESLGRLVAALPEPALLIDGRSVVVAANPRLEGAVGPPRLGEPLSFTLRNPEVLEAARAVAAGEPARLVEFQTRVPVDRWYAAHVTPVSLAGPGGTSAPDVTLVLLRDLTQQRRLEQMRADFVANASHELRTPLASLSGFIETLQGSARNDPAARERFLGIMGEQARRMSRLIDDLLSLSRIELNAHVRPDTVVDLVLLLREVVDALAPLAQERGVAVRLTAPSAPLPVRGDRDQLVRVMENLVENALKYGSSERGIDVTAARERRPDGGEEAVVTVRDHGPGIAPEHLPRLTERFYRVDAAHSRQQGGTGLGLAIVKHILARHRGQLAIHSELGRGATFEVRVDVVRPDSPGVGNTEPDQ